METWQPRFLEALAGSGLADEPTERYAELGAERHGTGQPASANPSFGTEAEITPIG